MDPQKYIANLSKRSTKAFESSPLRVLSEEELEALEKWEGSPSYKALRKYLKHRKTFLSSGFADLPLRGVPDRDVVLEMKNLQSRLAEDEYILKTLVTSVKGRLEEVRKRKEIKSARE